MPPEDNTTEPSKLTVFRSAEEMKTTPYSFPSTKPVAQLQAEMKDIFARLRLTISKPASRATKRKAK